LPETATCSMPPELSTRQSQELDHSITSRPIRRLESSHNGTGLRHSRQGLQGNPNAATPVRRGSLFVKKPDPASSHQQATVAPPTAPATTRLQPATPADPRPPSQGSSIVAQRIVAPGKPVPHVTGYALRPSPPGSRQNHPSPARPSSGRESSTAPPQARLLSPSQAGQPRLAQGPHRHPPALRARPDSRHPRMQVAAPTDRAPDVTKPTQPRSLQPGLNSAAPKRWLHVPSRRQLPRSPLELVASRIPAAMRLSPAHRPQATAAHVAPGHAPASQP